MSQTAPQVDHALPGDAGNNNPAHAYFTLETPKPVQLQHPAIDVLQRFRRDESIVAIPVAALPWLPAQERLWALCRGRVCL